MKKNVMLVLGIAVAGVLLSFKGEAIARAVGGLYGNRLHVETEPRNATPDVTLGDDDAFIAGTAEIDGATRVDGALDVNAAADISGSLTLSGGALIPFARTKAQFDAMTPAAAGLVYWCSNCTEKLLCVSTGTSLSAFQRSDSETIGCGTNE